MRELRRLLGYLGPYRRDLLIAAVMIILETAFEMVIPVLMADIIDVGVANRDVAVILQRGIQMGVCALLALATGLLYARFIRSVICIMEPIFRHLHSVRMIGRESLSTINDSFNLFISKNSTLHIKE